MPNVFTVRNNETNEFEGQRDTLAGASALAASLQANNGGTYTIKASYKRPTKVGTAKLKAMLNDINYVGSKHHY